MLNDSSELSSTLIVKHADYDAIIVGAGAAGLSAALACVRSQAYQQFKQEQRKPRILVIAKLPAIRAHTGSAEGGIAASLGNVEEDHWQWHYYDTVRGSDWLSDQDAAKLLAQRARETVIQLEHDGVAFSRTSDGYINQRKFGGHTSHFGQIPVKRAAYAADRIGHQILHSLWQQCLAHDITFAEEYYVTDLAINHAAQRVEGVVAFEESTGQLHAFSAPSVLIATGGAGRLFGTTSNSWDLTGDGMALALQAGLQIEDCEFMQFHPTGLAHSGILLSEASRAEGGILRNVHGEAFMKRYDPLHADLAPRDVVSRAINQEVQQGRGVHDPQDSSERCDCVWLDMTHIDKDHMREVLPQVYETILHYASLDPSKTLIPVHPTAHYMMGGIPTTLQSQVYAWDGSKRAIIHGLFAAGECACVGVHGANRLGGNSLLDACLFGTIAGEQIAQTILAQVDHDDSCTNMRLDALAASRADQIRELLHNVHTAEDASTDTVTCISNPYEIFSQLGKLMDDHAAIQTNQTLLEQALNEIQHHLIPQANTLRLHSSILAYNQELLAYWQAHNLLELAQAVVRATLARKESRGCLYRTDYPKHDDSKLAQHSHIDTQGKLTYQPVHIVDFKPNQAIQSENLE